MRALYAGASQVRRYEHRQYEIDVVTYEEDHWIAYVFGPGVDGKRLSPFSTAQAAVSIAKLHVDQFIESLKPPPEDDEKPKPRNAKRSRKRKKKKDTA